MIVLPVLLGGWSVWSNRLNSPHPVNITYHITREFADQVSSMFHMDIPFVNTYTSDDVVRIVNEALYMWGSNAPVHFLSSDRISQSMIVFTMSLSVQPPALASWSRPKIAVNPSVCWYEHRDWCDAVTGFRTSLHVVGTCFSILLTIPLLRVWYNYKASGGWEYATTVLLTLVLLAYISDILPCFDCVDLKTVLAHEVGHALGMGHADADTAQEERQCGCNWDYMSTSGNLSHCQYAPSVMSKQYVLSKCLSQDDVDAVRSLYQGECHAATNCSDLVKTYRSVIRAVVIMICALLLSAILIMPPRVRKYWETSRCPTEPIVATVALKK